EADALDGRRLAPGAGAIDGLAVDAQPVAHVAEALLHDHGDAPVGRRTHVEQEVAAFGDDVDKHLDDLFARAVIVQRLVPVVAEGAADTPALLPRVRRRCARQALAGVDEPILRRVEAAVPRPRLLAPAV